MGRRKCNYRVIYSFNEVENYFMKGMANVFVGVIVHLFGNDILIIKESDKKLFRFPGGGVRNIENIPDAIRREIIEEVGFKINIDALKFLVAYSVPDELRTVDGHLIVFFEYNMIDGWKKASDEEISRAIEFSGSDEVTTEIRFVGPYYDDFGRVVLDKNDQNCWLSPFHLRALRIFLDAVFPEFCRTATA